MNLCFTVPHGSVYEIEWIMLDDIEDYLKVPKWAGSGFICLAGDGEAEGVTIDFCRLEHKLNKTAFVWGWFLWEPI